MCTKAATPTKPLGFAPRARPGAWQADGFRTLNEGEQVEFEVEPGRGGKGPQAKKVRRI